MLYASYGLIRASARVMMEAAPEGIDPDAIGRALAAYSGVAEVHDLHIWEVTSGFPAISAHIVVDAGHDCHEIRRALSTTAARPLRARALDPAGRTRTRASAADADRGGRPWRRRLTRSAPPRRGASGDSAPVASSGKAGRQRATSSSRAWSRSRTDTGSTSGRYQHVAARLNEAGFAVYGLDHHGHGRSAGQARADITAPGRRGPRPADRHGVAGAKPRVCRNSCSDTAWAARSRCATRWHTRTG